MSDPLLDVLQQYWGYDDFRPLQREAMQSVLDNHDSVVVLPTGAGKSLCYQAPALCLEGLAVVVSPLISLMKDQVDSLQACGISAAYLNSTLSNDESWRVKQQIRAGELKLLYIAPERLTMESMMFELAASNISFIAIDEAHCVSMWGHDFRPHYRELSLLKETFPGIGIHAYTATATEQVREDIAEQLRLNSPSRLVGSFDRPNLSYSVSQSSDKLKQICEVIDRHPNESGIIYCISRAEVERISDSLNGLGYRSLPYHAGLSDEDRHANQESFIQDHSEIIVATIAFGMGVDKPNVRYVIHAGLPKSLENYQQEAGRAGRDGLHSECHLIYSEADAYTWERILSDQPEETFATSIQSVRTMLGYCHRYVCRHRQLVEHFGQTLEQNCETGCDVCRGDFEMVETPMVLAQKILSSVYRQEQRFGSSYTAAVLKGSRDKKVLANGHENLSTYGLLKEENLPTIRHFISQLTAQGFLQKQGEYQLLKLTESGWKLLKGEGEPHLIRPRIETKAQKSSRRAQQDSGDDWEGVDRDLFDRLRGLRLELAEERSLQPYMVFSDVTLRSLARQRPSSLEGMLAVKGIGEKKCKDFGQLFLELIDNHSEQHDLERDINLVPAFKPQPTTGSSNENGKKKLSAAAIKAFPYFEKGMTLKQVGEELDRARSTVAGYFSQYLTHHQITDASRWLDEETIEKIEQAIDVVGDERLRPLFEHLNEEIDYDSIRIVVSCRRLREETSSQESTG